MLVHATIDPDACIGSGECVAIDPEAVELDNHGTARLLVDQLEKTRAERLCDACPLSAISIQAR
jgi:ferredoxin